MLIGLRNAMMAGKRLSAKSYVQSGLIAMWDGIENDGWGKHNASATAWKDLTGGVFGNLPISAAGVDSVFYTQFSGYKKDVEFTMPGTMEMMVRSCNNAFFNIGAPSNYPSLTSTGGYITFSPYNANYEFWSKNTRGIVSKSGIEGKPMRIIFGSGKCLIYANTGLIGQWTDGNTTSVWGSFAIGNYANAKLTCESCYIRLYSRALTADEMAANYAVDKARFNLPDAT